MAWCTSGSAARLSGSAGSLWSEKSSAVLKPSVWNGQRTRVRVRVGQRTQVSQQGSTTHDVESVGLGEAEAEQRSSRPGSGAPRKYAPSLLLCYTQPAAKPHRARTLDWKRR